MTKLSSIFVSEEKALASVRSLVSIANPGSIYLIQGDKNTLFFAMQELIDRCALIGPVRVIVGGNRISFDHLPLVLGDQANDVYEIMDRISVSRAETCYQMFDVLRELEPGSSPVVITDMLESFYDEDLALGEVSLLLQDCLVRIKEISCVSPVLIGASSTPERIGLIGLLEEASNSRIYFEAAIDSEKKKQYGFVGF